MASKGYSVHVGVEFVNPSSYGGRMLRCQGPRQDVETMRCILSKKGFEPVTLENQAATRQAVCAELRRMAGKARAGDICVFTYSGHGAQIRDFSGAGDEREDETLCCFDGNLLDDELARCISEFKANVRVVTVCDSCNSRSVVEQPVGMRHFSSEEEAYKDIKAQVLHFAGSLDGAESFGGLNGGVLTNSIRMAIADPNSAPRGYPDLYAQVQANARVLLLRANRPNAQAPQFVKVANVSDGFIRQRPFEIEAPGDWGPIQEEKQPVPLELPKELKDKIDKVSQGAKNLLKQLEELKKIGRETS